MKTPELLLPKEYVTKATEHINASKDHVSFISMMVTDDHATNKLLDALATAAQRGVNVQVAADVFTYGELNGHFFPTKYYTKAARATTNMGKKLSESGVHFTWLGRFSMLPITGRTHSKCLVIDDTVYSFGGVNLYDESLTYTDYMFKCIDKQLALELRDEIARLIRSDGGNFSYRSHDFSYGRKSQVLIDGGFQGDSIIYRRACQLARESENILFVSQYCPSGKLGRILQDKNAKLYFNSPENAKLWNRLIIRTGMIFSGNRTLYNHPNYLHAKFIIFTMPGGKKVAITGSHNFMPGSVLSGTREIAIETSDAKIISQLEKFFKQYIA